MNFLVGIALSVAVSAALVWHSLTTPSGEACSVADLLATRLADTVRTGVNERVGLNAVGYSHWMLRNPNESAAFTQLDRLRGVERTLLCALRLFNDTPWWLIGGSLIGVLRHGALLPHDTDADILLGDDDFRSLAYRLRRQRQLVPPTHYSDEDKRSWRRIAPRRFLFSDGECAIVLYGGGNITVAKIGGAPVGLVVDVGTGFLSDIWIGNANATTFRWWEFEKWRHLPLTDLLPLERRPLAGALSLMVPVPRQIEALLAQSFDGDFRNPKNMRMVLALFTRLPSTLLARLLLLASVAAVAGVVPWWATTLNAVAAVLLLFWSTCAGVFALAALCFAAALALQLRPRWHWRVAPLALLALLCAVALRTAAVCMWFRQSDWIDYRSFWNGHE